MAKLFFLLSGEHEKLPISELKAILETENYDFKISEKLDQVLRLESDAKCVETIKFRASFTKLCGLELFCCKAKTATILKTMHFTSLKEVLKSGESFAVRIRHVKNYAPEIDSMNLERKLGDYTLHATTNTNVNLKNPDKTLTGVLTNKKFIFGLKLVDVPSKPFAERRPRRKPFFHPSAMSPKLARCMINLAKPKTGELVLDPFCGTGSVLIEAALMNCQSIGLDIQRRMVKGSIRNALHFNVKPEGVIVADARNPPVKETDCIVTDPPYGRSASTFKRTTKQIIEEMLTAVYRTLSRGKRVCIAAPKTLNVRHIGKTIGYKHLESHFVYVHRSLTREIAIFEKV